MPRLGEPLLFGDAEESFVEILARLSVDTAVSEFDFGRPRESSIPSSGRNRLFEHAKTGDHSNQVGM